MYPINNADEHPSLSQKFPGEREELWYIGTLHPSRTGCLTGTPALLLHVEFCSLTFTQRNCLVFFAVSRGENRP